MNEAYFALFPMGAHVTGMTPTMLCCSHLAKTFNEGRPIYYRVERDGLDELRMRGLVWIDTSSMDGVRVYRKGCSRPCSV